MPDQVHPPMPPGASSDTARPFASPRRQSTRFSFLPLSEEGNISTRGQHLPNVIRNRSSTALGQMARYGSFSSPKNSRSAMVRSTSPLPGDEDLESGRRLSHGSGDRDRMEPPTDFSLGKGTVCENLVERAERERKSVAPSFLVTPEMRSQRLIGNSNPRYKWEQYYKTEEELKPMKRPLRKYYERNNYLIQQYLYIDRLLDSSLPHTLVQEYDDSDSIVDVPATIAEEEPTKDSEGAVTPQHANGVHKVKRTKDIYRLHDEETPLMSHDGVDVEGPSNAIPAFEPEEETETGDRIVAVAIYLNFAANAILLILKIIVTVMTSSLSVLASLVDAALDFLSTFIVWTTSRLISHSSTDIENYPVGRRRLEPIGVLVFSVIMITSFFQVAIESFQRLMSDDHEIVQLSAAAIAIMASTVLIKFGCWLWCRFIKNSSVQALAQDAMTDVVFNIFSIIFPLLGYYFSVWFLDPLGGLLLSLYVILNWSFTTRTHILNLTGRAAGADERNVLLYLTMRFAHTIKHIQGLAAYHAGDKLNVEVDIVLDSGMSLRDSHDLGESLQYVLESVPGVERAFVHTDYKKANLPSHMRQ